MRLTALAAGAAVLLTGCGGGSASIPIYTITPTSAPLRYELTTDGNTVVETPGGTQETPSRAELILAVQYGASTEAGTAVTITFESVSVSQTALGNTTDIDASELIGKSASALIADDGSIEVTEMPEVSGPLGQVANPNQIISSILPPLPPGGDVTLESWPDVDENVVEGPITLTITRDGTASFAADTMLSGRSARVIQTSGETEFSGSGEAPGAGEIDMNMDGDYSGFYVWDAAAGVLLGATIETEVAGMITGIGFTIPGTVTSKTTIRLLE